MTNPIISIAGRRIGCSERPYIIAEMSANHNGNIENAFRIIDEAKKAGADAIKIQTYRADTMTVNSTRDEFMIRGGLWDGWNLYKLYEWAHTPWEWHQQLFEYAAKIGITMFSTPFDTTAADLLEELGAPAYKIASFEAIDVDLIRYVAGKGKPMIISTGMANLEEIEDAIRAAQEGGCKELAVLHCVSGYPTPARDFNLRTLPDIAARYGLVGGLSDHSLDNTAAITSVALGASIIEKHFTLDRKGGGPDDSFSIEPKELAELVASTTTAWEALGNVDYGLKSSERGSTIFRRSLYFMKDLEAGETITADAIRCIRPGYGAAPKLLPSFIGKKAKKAIEKYSPASLEFVE